ncbi:MAG: Fur family transcriptional regulator [Chloroflexota bacterium]|nr:Fur family transcriptional regulator [Chloroflexota bacterium]
MDEAHLKQELRAAGYRLTRPRRAVLRVVAEATQALTPAQMHEQARMRYPQTGLVTVYRTLELLAELDLVRRIHTEEGCHGYVPVAMGEAGHHLVCTSCHQAVEFPCTGMEETLAGVERLTGFSIQEHWLELFGLCPACQAKERDRSEQ